MQAFIDLITRNLLKLWPIGRIYTWETGIIVRGGIIKRPVGPGLWWRWPFLDEVWRSTASEQTIDLKPACVTTTDRESVAVSANFAYRVRDVQKMWSGVSSLQGSLANVGLGFLADECSRRSWEDLRNGGRVEVQEALRRHVTEQLKPWGVEITRVQITHLVKARQLYLHGEGPRA